MMVTHLVKIPEKGPHKGEWPLWGEEKDGDRWSFPKGKRNIVPVTSTMTGASIAFG